MDEIRHPQFMWIMNVVGSVVSLFDTVLTTCADFRYGRLAAKSAKRGSRELPHSAQLETAKEGAVGTEGNPRGTPSASRQTEVRECDLHPLRSSRMAPALPHHRTMKAFAFGMMHVVCFGVFVTGANMLALLLCGAVYFVQMVGITAGYHRYFAHRTYKTSRAFQFVLAWLGCSAAQRGPIWWAAQHRHHHRTSDTLEDLHSPIAYSCWQSHIGWVFSPESDDTAEQTVKDLIRYPELRWLDRYYWLPPPALAGLCFLIGGWASLVWGFFVSSVLSHHATFKVNSVCHLWGRRRYATSDASRNNLFVALITLGEGWHNNHHHYQSSAQQGFRWWEIDVSYYLIRLLACLRLVYDVRKVPKAKLWAER